MLEHNRYYVHDFDHLQQTALHWAAKRNYPDAINLLIEYGAVVNAFDIVWIYIIFFLTVVIGRTYSFVCGCEGESCPSCEGVIGSARVAYL